MRGFIGGQSRNQSVLLREHLEDYIHRDNFIRVIDIFVEELNLNALGFAGVEPARTGRPITRRCCSRSTSTGT